MTFTAVEPEQILSQDAQGRVLVTRERRESLLAEYHRSGMSGVKFAQYVGIKYSTLAYWLPRRRQQRQKEKSLIKAGADTKLERSKYSVANERAG
jgi:transposase